MLRKLWQRLQGKKTYLLSATCIGMALLQAAESKLQGHPVDWTELFQHIATCLVAMSLRHGIGKVNGNGNHAQQASEWKAVR